MRRAQVEAHVLVLVTLGLVAFGLVMVPSATSAPAALGHGDPNSYLKRQAAYALAGFVLLLLLSRVSYRALRRLAPTLVAVALFLCVAVLVVGTEVNGATRWLTFGPATFQPSELAKLAALAVWAAAYLTRTTPHDLRSLLRPLGLLVGLFCGLLLLQPDLGTAISLVVMIGAILVVAAGSGGALAAAWRHRRHARDRRDLVRAVPPRTDLQLPEPVGRLTGIRVPDRPGDHRPGSGGVSGGRPRAGRERESPTSWTPRRT